MSCLGRWIHTNEFGGASLHAGSVSSVICHCSLFCVSCHCHCRLQVAGALLITVTLLVTFKPVSGAPDL